MATTENTYTGDGSTVLYNFTFPYISETDVYVSLNGTVTTAYSYANATTLQFTTAPASGVAIRIYRETSSADIKAAFFAGSAIRSKDLNDNFTQTLYLSQESGNVADDAETKAAAAQASAATANTNATAAAASAATATQQATASAASSASALAASQQASTDAAAAQASSSASATSSAAAAADAAQAATDSASAIATANASTTASTAATNTANTAISRVNTYVHDGTNPQGDGVGSNPQGLAYAINQSTSAVTTANAASTSAASSASTVSTYVHDGTNPAGDGVGGNPQGLAYAINQSTSAVTTANAASAAVANAVLYAPVANVSAIPGSPSNGDYIEVQDSTGIQSFSPLSGLPSGFVGASGLTVRLKYVTSPSTAWQWQNYFANDSETRYVDQTSGTGAANLPVGTTAQRNSSPSAGQIRYNSTLGQFEGYSTSWGGIGGGATGGGSDQWAIEHDNTITASYTISTGKNVISAGPITVNSGATVTVPSGSNWTVV